jgi:hypothetical protein
MALLHKADLLQAGEKYLRNDFCAPQKEKRKKFLHLWSKVSVKVRSR